MSASDANSAIYVTDTPKEIKNKVCYFVLESELYFQLENDIFMQLLLLWLASNSCEIVIRVESGIMVFFDGLINKIISIFQVNRYAFSGGQDSIELHRKLGANLDVSPLPNILVIVNQYQISA
jgi:hypothetical protein